MFLTEEGGLESGLMMAQYTAAALASENKVLAHPASADSVPSSANVEDHVSMGATATRHTAQVLDHVDGVEMVLGHVVNRPVRGHPDPDDPENEPELLAPRDRAPRVPRPRG